MDISVWATYDAEKAAHRSAVVVAGLNRVP